ncbi:hypothetical protein PROVRUST_07445 [Providencia rustigianii DSM 4541]|uniref:Uncharacterized protein n=1 Tax=Providencia rustigianii DSM 4541 TaxID=500637 RepID=D1P5E0_9GAMM|nr:hypothetical protein PROVRUST_07445 [Providencia rustigianii DSM 4541]
MSLNFCDTHHCMKILPTKKQKIKHFLITNPTQSIIKPFIFT